MKIYIVAEQLRHFQAVFVNGQVERRVAGAVDELREVQRRTLDQELFDFAEVELGN